MKKMKKLSAFIVAFAVLFSCIAPITKVFATSYGEGSKVLHMDIVNTLAFTVDSVTVNGDTWAGAADEFHTNGNEFHIVINVSGNSTTGEKVPRVQYGGNWNNYITPSTQHNGNNHTFVLDVDANVTTNPNQNFLALEILEQENEPNPNEPHFDGKAYLFWSCSNGKLCMHYFDNIPNFDNGNSQFYKASEVTDDFTGEKFNVNATYKGWATQDLLDAWETAYKQYKGITGDIDPTTVDPKDIIGDPIDMRPYEEDAMTYHGCTKDEPRDVFESCVDDYALSIGVWGKRARLQPLPDEPTDNNAYVSYGDRNFKVVIYNEDYKGVSLGSLDKLHYYPAYYTNAFIRQDQFDISSTSKENPTVIDSILLESTVSIKELEYNSFSISSIEALDVPEGAVTISKVDNEWKLVFSSNFYDNVVFKVTDSNGNTQYFKVHRYTIDGRIDHRENNTGAIVSNFYFDRTKSYTDFIVTAKIVYKNGKTKTVNMEAVDRIDDGLGNITYEYEVDEEEEGEFGVRGKGLKKSAFEYQLDSGEADTISKIYINVENKGSTDTNYAGAFTGSGEGVLINVGGEE